jgi:very-short-patch-repair endonuclease/alkylated DNA nucleotide flippase Atl1
MNDPYRSANLTVPSVCVKQEDGVLIDISRVHHHLVGLEMVRRSGLTDRQWRRRVTSGEWVEMYPGVWRHAATPPTWDLRVRAAARWLGDDAALAGVSAARWWGLDGFAEVDEVEFVVPRSRRSTSGIALHTVTVWEPRDLLRKEGIRLTNVIRTVIDMAGHGVRARQLESAIDSGARLRLMPIERLRERLSELSGSGRGGVRLLRELLLDSGGESDLERRFLRLMRANGLPRPSTQVALTREQGRAMRVDFLFREANLVVEVSGRLGHTSDRDRRDDTRRRNALTDQGMIVKEFTTVDVVGDPEYVVGQVVAALSSFMSR